MYCRKTFSALLLCVSVLATPVYANDHEHNSGFRSDSYFDFTDKERWIFRARALGVLPDEGASISPIGGTVDIGDQYVPEIDFTYFFTKNMAAEAILATTPHDVEAINTTAGNVDLGSVWLLPPTVTLQYHFMPDNKGFRPYVGAGVNYTLFYGVDEGVVNDIEYDNSIGYALQAGFDYGIDENWGLNFDAKKVMINSDVTIQSGATRINADVDIDPWILGMGVAYRF